MQEFTTILSNFGFPVAIASYLLFRFERKLEMLEVTNQTKVQAINALTAEVGAMKTKITDLEYAVKNISKK